MKPQVITFSNDKVPVFSEVRNKDYINYGEDNNYPNFLVTLFNRSAKHNAILTAKQLYIAGQGLAFNAENLPTDKIVSTQAFIDNANPYESLHSVSSKMALDIELFGGCYLHIIKSKDKKNIAEVYHLDYCNLRTNKDNSLIYYSEHWLNDDGSNNTSIKEDQITTYPAYGSKEYEKGKEGVLYYKQYRPNIETYTLPEYIGAVPAIITDAEIANYHRASIQNGFMGGTMVVFANGVPSDEEMSTIERQMKKKFTGTDRANSLVIDFVDDPARVPQVLQLTGNDFDKRYDALNKTIQEEIFVGHKVTSPMLFGVRTEGQLGGRNEMATAFQLFQNTYITPKQDAIEVILNYTPSRDVTNDFVLKKLNSAAILTPYFHNSNTGGSNGTEILGGLYNLRLPTTEFNRIGVYTLYIRPAEIRTTITDCGVLSALPNVKGIIIDLNDVPSEFRNKFTSQGLVGFRVEYLNSDGSKIPNFYRIITSSFFCEPVVTDQTNTSQKSIRYRYLDSGSDLLFCTLSPSAAPTNKPNVTPFIGQPNQRIIISNTYFNPFTVDIQIAEHDLDTLAIALYGNQTKSIEDGCL